MKLLFSLSLRAMFLHNIDLCKKKKAKLIKHQHVALFMEKNLCLTLEIRAGYIAAVCSGGECVGVKKETPLPPQGINNIHSYRGD